jgi:uncharacterized protein YcbK (DUF882 family)
MDNGLLSILRSATTKEEGVRQMNNIQASQNFKLSEFQCKCGCQQVKLHSELLRRLQAIRTETGRAVVINSGYRCPAHNRAVGGASGSQHLHGRAADITIQGLNIQAQRAICEKYFADGGVGYGKTFTHVDVRGSKARWNY